MKIKLIILLLAMAMEAQSQLNKAQVEALENFSFIPEVEINFYRATNKCRQNSFLDTTRARCVYNL